MVYHLLEFILIKNRTLNSFIMEIKTFLIEGMFCNNCKIHVEQGIKKVQGIEDVIVDVNNGQVRVSGNMINIDLVKGAVEQSGYIFKGEISIASRNSDLWLS
jgi:copper chaperone CopZ